MAWAIEDEKGLRTRQWGTGLPRLLRLRGMDLHPSSWAKRVTERAQGDPPEFIHFQWYWVRWRLGGILPNARAGSQVLSALGREQQPISTLTFRNLEMMGGKKVVV